MIIGPDLGKLYGQIIKKFVYDKKLKADLIKLVNLNSTYLNFYYYFGGAESSWVELSWAELSWFFGQAKNQLKNKGYLNEILSTIWLDEKGPLISTFSISWQITWSLCCIFLYVVNSIYVYYYLLCHSKYSHAYKKTFILCSRLLCAQPSKQETSLRTNFDFTQFHLLPFSGCSGRL